MHIGLARLLVSAGLLAGMGMCGGIGVPAIAGGAISFGGEQSAFVVLGMLALLGAGLVALMIKTHSPDIPE